MKRALLIVLDSVGVGYAQDAVEYGDEGADTLGHVYESNPEMSLPNLEKLGLAELREAASGQTKACDEFSGSSGIAWMREHSVGKDSTTGHWEIAGVHLQQPFATYEAFPSELITEIEEKGGCRFIGNGPASGTAIIEELGEEHLKTGFPILYTSADSVLQIAAHQEVMSVEGLYRLCEVARSCADPYRIGRVIARPFDDAPRSSEHNHSEVSEDQDSSPAAKFERSRKRKDFSMPPPPTVLNHLQENSLQVISIGKIGDLFAHSGIDQSYPTKNNAEGMAKVGELWEEQGEGLIFVNLVDFDVLYGHRRDPSGYAECLREFDNWLGEFLPKLSKGDLLMITADHGNDPTWRGTDHTREMVPLILKAGDEGRVQGCYGERSGFYDLAATLCRYFQIDAWEIGKPLW